MFIVNSYTLAVVFCFITMSIVNLLVIYSDLNIIHFGSPTKMLILLIKKVLRYNPKYPLIFLLINSLIRLIP